MKDGNDNPVCETAKETQMYKTVFWTLWERERVGWFRRIALKHVYIIYETNCQSRFDASYWMLGAGELGCSLLFLSPPWTSESSQFVYCWNLARRILCITLLAYAAAAAVAAKSLQSCPTLCDPINVSQPGSPIPGILQARTLEWVAISFSNAWKWKVKVKSLSRVWLLATPWTVAYKAPPSMGFSRQEYWSGVPSPSPASVWDECNCAVVWTFFGIVYLWDWNEN